MSNSFLKAALQFCTDGSLLLKIQELHSFQMHQLMTSILWVYAYWEWHRQGNDELARVMVHVQSITAPALTISVELAAPVHENPPRIEWSGRHHLDHHQHVRGTPGRLWLREACSLLAAVPIYNCTCWCIFWSKRKHTSTSETVPREQCLDSSYGLSLIDPERNMKFHRNLEYPIF
jgi:hypothetical protein